MSSINRRILQFIIIFCIFVIIVPTLVHLKLHSRIHKHRIFAELGYTGQHFVKDRDKVSRVNEAQLIIG